MCPIPASTKPGAALPQHFAVGWSRKGSTEPAAFGIWSPEDNPDIEAARNRSIEHIEQWAPTIRHPEVRCVEGNRKPDTMARLINGLADAPKDGHTIDEGTDRISCPRRI
jgi:hypothetical protein